jgi:site-specific DNA-methyltransferase (adenine-specific)
VTEQNVNVALQETQSLTSGTGSPVQEPTVPDGHVSLQPFRLIIEARQRKEFSDIAGMMESLKRFGLIQPIVVIAVEGKPGWFRLVAGERRTRAAIMLGWKSIPYVLKEHLNPLQLQEMELEENVRRSNLTMMEEAQALLAIDQLKRNMYGETVPHHPEKGWNTEKTADLVNQPANTVRRKIKLAKAVNANPELRELTANLPLAAAARLVEQHKLVKKVAKQHAEGKITLSTLLTQGDCRELIKKLANESVGLIITDPPFGLPDIEEARQKGGGGENQSYTAGLKQSDNLDLDQAVTLIRELAPDVHRVLRPGAHFYFFCSTSLAHFILEALEKAGLECQQSLLIWDKLRTTTPGRGYEYASCYEPIVFGWKPPRSKFLTENSPNILKFPALHATKKLHAFEKPGKLIRFLITQSSNIGDLVLDPFAGSGRTILEAKRLQRSALGFELDNDNFLRAQSRLILPMMDEEEENGKK